jgi:hypothetical protein
MNQKQISVGTGVGVWHFATDLPVFGGGISDALMLPLISIDAACIVDESMLTSAFPSENDAFAESGTS